MEIGSNPAIPQRNIEAAAGKANNLSSSVESNNSVPRDNVSITQEGDKIRLSCPDGDSDVSVKKGGLFRNKVKVTVDGEKHSFSKKEAEKLIVDLGEGNNKIGVSENIKTGLTIVAGNGDNKISAGSGNDSIVVGSGNNTISGLDGDDIIVAGNGNNNIYAGSGSDIVKAGHGNNTIYGGDGDDYLLAGNGNNDIFGQRGNDSIASGNGRNLVYGGQEMDFIFRMEKNNDLTFLRWE